MKNRNSSVNAVTEDCRLTAALSDPSGWPALPQGFAVRAESFLERTCAESHARVRRLHRVTRRAASVLLFAGLVSYAGYRLTRPLPVPEESPDVLVLDAETEYISQKGGATMIARKAAGLVGAALLSVSSPATELMSESTFVFLRPETSSFWHTATNNVMTVPIDYPAGATSASLLVSGLDYQKSYTDITSNAFTFELPAAESEGQENVYDLTLAFDDGTARHAKLGLVKGLSPDAEGTTRCIAPATGRVWTRANERAVLPIPHGTTSLRINGEAQETGLNGAQGWYALKVPKGETITLSLIANEVPIDATVSGMGGLLVIFK